MKRILLLAACVVLFQVSLTAQAQAPSFPSKVVRITSPLPTGLAIDGQNRIYVADAFNSRVSVYQLINTAAQDSEATVPPSAPATPEHQS